MKEFFITAEVRAKVTASNEVEAKSKLLCVLNQADMETDDVSITGQNVTCCTEEPKNG